MHSWKHRWNILISALLLSLITSIPAYGLEIAGDQSYPPYSFKANGKITGIYTDIIASAVTRMEQPATITFLPWKRGLSDLKNGKLPMLYPPYYRPQQRPYMAYSTAILEETLVIYCHRDLKLTDKQFPQDYTGLTFGQNSGFSSGPAVEAATHQGIIRLTEVNSTAANLKKLFNRRIDCYINDRLSIQYQLALMNKARPLTLSDIEETHILSREKGYLAFNKEAGNDVKRFIEQFNQVIATMKASGEIDAIVERYTRTSSAAN